MKLRPQVQFRFRDVPNYEAVKEAVGKSGLSLNEWLLGLVERELGKNARVVVDETPEEQERTRRKAKKAARHRQLKEDAQAAVEAEGVPAKFMERVNTPSEGHHANCGCLRCKIKRGEVKGEKGGDTST
jgi:hypothetical protein